MKVVQVGILAALVVVAGLLFMVYRQGAQPKVDATPAAAVTPATPAATPEPVAAPAPPPEAAVSPAVAEKPVAARVERKPSPAPMKKRAQPAVSEQPRTEVAQEQPAPAVQPPTPPAPVQPAPAAPADPPVAAAPALNPPSGTPTAPRQPHHVTIPAGTLLPVRLNETLSSDKNQPGDSFTATLDQPLVIDGFVIAERGSRLEGRVLESEKAGRVKGLSALAVHLVSLRTSDGQKVDIQTERFAKEGEASRGDDVKKVGVGAALGAAIGAIAGGGKGAAIGAGVGGAAGTGTVLATRGKNVTLPVETRISFKLQAPVTLTEKLK